MPRKSKKHSTPEELDKFFARNIITEDQYGTFWENWWDADRRERKSIIKELLEGSEWTVPGTLTTDIKVADYEADLMNGYVVRRNKKGQFSKHGSIYQALPKRRKRNAS